MNNEDAAIYIYDEIKKIERAHMADLLNISQRKLKKEVVDEILSMILKLEIDDEN